MINNKKLFGSVAVALAVAAYPLFASEVAQEQEQEQVQVQIEEAAPVAEEAAPAAEEAAKADCECSSCN